MTPGQLALPAPVLTLEERYRLSVWKAEYAIGAKLDPDDEGWVNVRWLAFLRWLVKNGRHPEFP